MSEHPTVFDKSVCIVSVFPYPYHVAFCCIFNGLNDPQSLFEAHLFDHVGTNRTKFLIRNNGEETRGILG